MNDLRDIIRRGIIFSERRHQLRIKEKAISLRDKHYLLIDFCEKIKNNIEIDYDYLLYLPSTTRRISICKPSNKRFFEIKIPLNKSFNRNIDELEQFFLKKEIISHIEFHQYRTLKNNEFCKIIKDIITNFFDLYSNSRINNFYIYIQKFVFDEKDISTEDNLLSTFQGYFFIVTEKNIINNQMLIEQNLSTAFQNYINQISKSSVEDRLAFISKSLKEVRKIEYFDSYLPIFNKKKFNMDIKEIFEISKRRKKEFSLIFIDIDNFSNVNNTYGHDSGDIVLFEMISSINKIIEKDNIYRYGGEEFCIIVENSIENNPLTIAEKIRTTIESNVIQVPHKNQNINITASFGISTFPKHGENIKKIIENADVALLKSKRAGKNQVTECSL